MTDAGQSPLLSPEQLPPLIAPYIDSPVFLSFIKQESSLLSSGLSRFDVAKKLLDDARSGRFIVFTSTVTLAEVRRVRGATEQLTSEEITKINQFFSDYLEHEYIMPIEVSREVGEKAQSIGAIYNLSPMDAIHIATAILWECNVVLTLDRRTMLDRIPTGEIEGVYIREAYWTGQVPLSS